MGLTWIRVAIDLPNHPKSLLLEQELGERHAFVYLQKIWGWCTQYSKDGRLSGILAAIIERAAGWDGEPGKLLKAAEKVRFLDLDERNGGWVCHDWEEHQGKAIRAAEAESLRKKQTYERRREEFARKERGNSEEPPPIRDVTRRDVTRRKKHTSFPAAREKAPDPRHAPLKERLVGEYKTQVGGEYGFNGGQDAKAISGLIKKAPDEEILLRWKRGLCAPPGWARIRNIHELDRKWNDLGQDAPRQAGDVRKGVAEVDESAWANGGDGGYAKLRDEHEKKKAGHG